MNIFDIEVFFQRNLIEHLIKIEILRKELSIQYYVWKSEINFEEHHIPMAGQMRGI